MNDDDLQLIDDDEEIASGRLWHVLVVDDEEEVHGITKLALSGFEFSGCGLQFHHAYSAKQAMEMLEQRQDFAVMLVDVVMETDHAGLDFVKHVREVAKLKFPRIVLRTGQPGQAPERQVITTYDINDYKQKTELTQEKMFTVMHTGIASYRDLVALDSNRRGLRKVIEACGELFTLQSMDQFAQGVLEQLTAVLYLGDEAMIVRAEGFAAKSQDADLHILAGTGKFRKLVGKDARETLDQKLLAQLERDLSQDPPVFEKDHVVATYQTAEGDCNLLYVADPIALENPDRELIELFCANVAKAQDNLTNILQKLGQ